MSGGFQPSIVAGQEAQLIVLKAPRLNDKWNSYRLYVIRQNPPRPALTIS
jgi:hypothetical protein